ncbi:MAG: acetylglutamate kinase [Clostridia bacterium]|nr:acetylglutamate kinase [Clostridia bacterium]
MEGYQQRAQMLVEALPYIQRLFGKTVVIKYGGSAMLSEELTQSILEDVTLLKFVGMNPVLVHGGGPDINRMLKALDVEPHFVDGMRVTDDETMAVVQMVLAGKINKDIVAEMNGMKASAIGLCGIDGNIIRARKRAPENGVDLGSVGEIISVNVDLLNMLLKDQYIPVIAPVGVGENGESYNINADVAAGAVAGALEAEKLIYLTDTDGIRTQIDDPSTLLYVASRSDINNMIEDGRIQGGMLPKVQSCLDALDAGVRRVHILDGTIPHPILLEIFTDSGIGTMVTG